jgi:predicted porin
VGISRSFSETLSTSWLAGYRETTSDTLIATGFCIGADPGAKFPGCEGGSPVQTGTGKDDNVNSGSVYSASITKLLEQGELSASLSRSSNPSSDGELLDTTRLILAGSHKFSQKLSSSLSIEYSNAETISRVSNNSRKTDEDFFRVRPKLFWKWHRNWKLAAEYEYTENQDRNSDTATRNAFYLTLSYQHPKISISR